MATEAGPTHADLSALPAIRWSVFELIRWLEVHGGTPPLAQGAPPATEGIRLRGAASMSVPGGEIEQIVVVGTEDVPARVEITTHFGSLVGISSPLPHADVIKVRRAAIAGDRRAIDFLDIFHHRELSLLWKSWTRHRPHLLGTRAEASAGGRLLQRLARDPELHRARARLQGTRSASRLGAVLQRAVGAAVEVVQCVPRRQKIAPDQQTRLGVANQLGTDTLLGDWTWEAGSGFVVRIGPVNAVAFERLAPGGPDAERVREAVDGWLDRPMSWALEVLPDPDAGVQARLAPSANTAGTLGCTLGRDTWLGAGASTPLRYDMT